MTKPITYNAASSVQSYSVVKLLSPIHLILQTALAILFFFANELDRILNLWLILVPIIVIPTFIVGVVWIDGIIRNVIKMKWIKLASVAIAPIIVWSIYILLLRSGFDSQWIRFKINKTSYDATVSALENHHPRHYSWEWGSTGGAGVVNIFYSLVYDENDKIPLRESESSKGEDITIRNFGNHFFLVTRIYQ